MIYSLLCRRQRGIGIPFLIWIILPSRCHGCVVYQLNNCWMCLKLLDLLKKIEKKDLRGEEDEEQQHLMEAGLELLAEERSQLSSEDEKEKVS